ncbi:ABC transporter substrate-binding protein [Ktedonospora formicarum]|uniref:Riboflavin-binding protein RibY n=1 Tax=Ktedonospora formicarum TaxID=2778364 RepID=A0A8J3HTA8_9CHLR|nr:ABC transporter substrate-binding protein [Ktedonospora formicarum]GHO42876.1 riboflavin-binding protein RibY [Ktedonospora formicarum]
MSLRHRSVLTLSLSTFMLLSMLLMTACGGSTGTTSNSSGSKSISIGLGYVPDIQFAPFYVAKSKGYYSQAGLNVTFNHGVVTDLIGSMLAGKNTFVFAGGDELLSARNSNKQIKAIDVSTIFQKYPASLIMPADSPIKNINDLKGHTIGVPGPYGSTYTALLAFLYKAHLTTSDVKIQSIGYTQVPALLARRVDAVMGYANNEPLQLEKKGLHVRTFAVSDYQPLVSNGIIAPEETYQKQPEMVRAFVQATLKGLHDVIANPDEAVQTSKGYIPGMNQEQARDVLNATIPFWQGNGKPGYNDEATWQAMEQFMVAQKMIEPVSDLAQVYTNKTVA